MQLRLHLLHDHLQVSSNSFMDVSSVSKYGDHSVNDLLDTLIDIRLGGTQCEDVWDMV